MLENHTTPPLRPVLVASRVETLIERARTQLEVDPKRALEAAEQARRLADSIDDRSGLAESLELLGLAHRRLGALDLALEHLHWALLLYKETDNQNGVAACIGEIGHLHVTLEENPSTSTDYRELPDATRHPSRWGRENQDFQRIAALFALCDYHTNNLEHLLARLSDERELGQTAGVPRALERVSFSYLELGRYQYDEVLRYMLRALAGNAERAAGAVQDGPPNALEYAVRAFAQTSRRLRSTRTFELALAVARDMDEYRQGVDAPHRNVTDAPHRNAPKPDASALRLPAETVRYLERAVEIAQSIPSKALEHEAGELLDKARNLRTDLPEALERARKLEGTSPQLELDFAEYDPPELRTPPPTAKPPTAPDLNVLDSLEAESPDVYADALVGSEAIAPQIASRFGAITAPVAARVDDDALHTHVPIEPGKPPQYVDLSVAGVLTLGGIALTTVFAGRNPILGGGFAILTMLGSGYLISSALLPHVRRFERAALSFGFAVGVSPFVLPVLNNAATDRRFLLLGLALAAGVSLAILVAYRKRQQPVRLGPRPDETVWSGLASQILEDFDEEGP